MTPSGIRMGGGFRVWNLNGMREERPIRRGCCETIIIMLKEENRGTQLLRTYYYYNYVTT